MNIIVSGTSTPLKYYERVLFCAKVRDMHPQKDQVKGLL